MSAVCWHFAVSGLCSLGSLCTHAERGVPCVDVTPIFFMWEKLVGTHYKPAYIRLPSRLPVGESLSSQFACATKGSSIYGTGTAQGMFLYLTYKLCPRLAAHTLMPRAKDSLALASCVADQSIQLTRKCCSCGHLPLHAFCGRVTWMC